MLKSFDIPKWKMCRNCKTKGFFYTLSATAVGSTTTKIPLNHFKSCVCPFLRLGFSDGAKEKKCTICSQIFSKEGKLQKHLREHELNDKVLSATGWIWLLKQTPTLFLVTYCPACLLFPCFDISDSNI